MTKTLIVIFFSVWNVFFCFSPSKAFPAEPQKYCGRIAIVLGAVKNTAGTQVQEGMQLNRGEKIATEKDSFAKILLTDDSIIDVGPESRFVLQQCAGESKESSDINLNLELGRIRVNVNKNPETTRKTFKLQSPTSILAVRGTEFYLIWEKSETGEIFENIALTEGNLDILSRFENNKNPLKLTAGNEFKGTGIEPSKTDPKGIIHSGTVKIDQLTASEQRNLEESLKIQPVLESNPDTITKPFKDALLDPKNLPDFSPKPLNLFQGNFAQAQQGNYSVIFSAGGTVTTSSGTGNSGGNGGAGGGNYTPVYAGGTIRFYDQ